MEEEGSEQLGSDVGDELDVELGKKIAGLRIRLHRDLDYNECWRKISEDLNLPQDKCKLQLTKLLVKYRYHRDTLSSDTIELLDSSEIDWDYEFCLENFNRLCRFCCTLEEKNLEFTKIYDDSSEKKTEGAVELIEKIYFTIFDNTTFEPELKLSNLICSACNTKINKFYSFKKTCERNAELLMRVSANLEKESHLQLHEENDTENLTEAIEILDNLENGNEELEEEQNSCDSEPNSDEDEDELDCSENSVNNKDQEKPLKVRKKKKKILSFEDLSKKSYRGKNSQCPICGKLVKGIQMHLLIHTGEKRHKCSYCSKSFTQSGQLKRHINSHLNIRNYKCPEPSCDRTFVDPSSVTKHLVVHNKDDRKFQCSLCGSRFNRLGALRYHEKTHRQERSHVCDICKKSFLAKYDLTKHYRTHTGEKPYSCKYCDKKFSISKNAKVHLRVHTKEKPYSCKFCDLSFAYRSSMKNHLMKIHNHADVNLTLLRSDEEHLTPQLMIENLEIETIGIDSSNHQMIVHEIIQPE